MPVILNIASNLILGAAVPLMVRNSKALRQDFVCWQLLFLTAFEAVVFTPLSTYLFRFYPQWALLYAFDPQLYPELDRWYGLLTAGAVLLNFGAAILGFTLGRLGVLRSKTWLWALPLAAGAAVWATVLIGGGDRLVFIGDFDSFWAGNNPALYKRFAGWVGLGLYAASASFLIWLHKRFSSHDPALF